MQGVQFYGRGVQLIAQDVQLAGNMLGRAVLQGYTLRAREVTLQSVSQSTVSQSVGNQE